MGSTEGAWKRATAWHGTAKMHVNKGVPLGGFFPGPWRNHNGYRITRHTGHQQVNSEIIPNFLAPKGS